MEKNKSRAAAMAVALRGQYFVIPNNRFNFWWALRSIFFAGLRRSRFVLVQLLTIEFRWRQEPIGWHFARVKARDITPVNDENELFFMTGIALDQLACQSK